MPINSRSKGARGERAWRDECRENGYGCFRGVQHAGRAQDGSNPADTVWEVPLHTEVKHCERWAVHDWIAQAQGDGDAAGKPWIIAAKRNRAPWIVMMRSELFFALLRGDYAEASKLARDAYDTFQDSGLHGS